MTNDETKAILEEIAAKKNGVLLPEDLLDEAKDPAHPMHLRFEWDDAKAGHAHRLTQARGIIRSVKVITTTETRRIESVYYVPNSEKESAREQGYVAVTKVRTEREMAINTIKREFEQDEALLKRTRDLAIYIGLDVQAQLAYNMLHAMANSEMPTEAVVDGTEAAAAASGLE
jgi:flagellar basal body rod protein FlgC